MTDRMQHYKERALQYAFLMRLHKPIGIFLLLWPTLWALWISGEGHPRLLVFIVFMLGEILMRSAGCVLNDYADREIDLHVARTKDRPIATGNVTPKEALILFAALCIIAFGLVLLMNSLTIMLSIVGVVLAMIYPFMKRFTYLPQVFLGLAFGWAIPMAFAAQTGDVPKIGWLLLIATVLWATAYDTIYAMVDRPDDLQIGVKSTAILFGGADRYMVAGIQAAAIIVLFLIGKQLEMGAFYYSALVIAGGLAFYQQALLRERKAEFYLKAFLNNNWFGAVIFVGIVLHYIFNPSTVS